jgi:threonine dehydrogenase-like Zn-dependent dehydrogenase
MQAFLRLLADGKLQVNPLAPRHVPLEDAPQAYRELLDQPGRPPTIVFEYPAAQVGT